MMEADRRVQRTRQLLIHALMELIEEKGYDAVTIQDITDRANVGRTTFYLHFRSKEHLFLGGHLRAITTFHYDVFTREQLLSDEPPPVIRDLFQYTDGGRWLYQTMYWSQDSLSIQRVIKARVVEVMEASLRAAFDEADSAVPFPVLAAYIAGAQMEFMQWCVDARRNYSTDYLARMMQRLQRAAIRDALGIRE
jgi:AcrR family transcriptional regulator